ncbi:hypothetical protein EON65_28710, partial [archaeon]
MHVTRFRSACWPSHHPIQSKTSEKKPPPKNQNECARSSIVENMHKIDYINSKAMNIDQLLLDADSHDVFLKKLMGSVINSTKASNVLSKGLDFQINQTYSVHQSELTSTSSYTQELIQKLLDFCKISGGQGMDLPEDIADPVYYDRVVDAVDELLDRADRLLNAKEHDTTFSDIVKSVIKLDKDRVLFDNTLNVKKPQLQWSDLIDNTRHAPFRPHIIQKYHAKVDYVEEKELVDYNDSANAGFNTYEEEEGVVG